MTTRKEDLPLWMFPALAHVGVSEKAAGDHGSILNFYALCGHGNVKRDEVAWCAAYVGASLERVGIPSTRSLMARSYIAFGERLSEPQRGAVAVFPRGKDPACGHVGFIYDLDATHVWLLNGNVSNAVRITKRKRSEILPGGIRWPDIEPTLGPYFPQALDWVSDTDTEGAFDDHPDDPGGATVRGITIGRYRQWTGRKASVDDLRGITDAERKAIWLTEYWFATWCDLQPWPLNMVHFDCAVNQGPGDAAKFLQEAVRTTIDGQIGPETLRKARGADLSAVSRYFAIREKDYRGLSKFHVFGRGWLNRLARLKARINATKLETKMPTKAPVAAPITTSPSVLGEPPKWWGASKTVWGTLITFASTVLPIVSTLAGFPISGAEIQMIGEHGFTVLQVVGGLIGTLFAIYGRFDAKQPLAARQFTIKL